MRPASAGVLCRAAAAPKGCLMQGSGPGERAATLTAVVLRMLPGGHLTIASHCWHRWFTANEAHPPGASRPKGKCRLCRVDCRDPSCLRGTAACGAAPAVCAGAPAADQCAAPAGGPSVLPREPQQCIRHSFRQGAVLPHRVLLHGCREPRLLKEVLPSPQAGTGKCGYCQQPESQGVGVEEIVMG